MAPPAVSDKFISNDIKVLEIDKKIQIAVVLRINGNFTFIIVCHPVAPSTRCLPRSALLEHWLNLQYKLP